MSAITNLRSARETLDDIHLTYHLEQMPSPDIMVVSKTHPGNALLPLLEDGHRLFGENRVQEAKEKWPELQARFPDITLHLIGPLQTNKVTDALKLFDVIETLDRPKLAHAIADALQEDMHAREFYIQVNTGEEPQKAGILPTETDDFIHLCKEDLQLPVTGLMCIPPVDEEPSLHFGLLHTIAKRHKLPHLSMGMSNDFEVAAAMGATHIRLGTAILGKCKN